jgi:glycosyltransferase involved in cell wall biosynthesis
VHPSLFEGYCLPAAAAVSHGVPVVYTRGSGIDEVVAEAGVGLDPSADGQTWAETILALLANPDREKLCRTRWERALSWDDVAAGTAALYDKLGKR